MATMAKILLVEDDNNLREIYEARLQAEGYTIVSAQDGEDALVKAKQEKPDLVISDVMMPRISGFEMLDILRNTEGLKTTKVIMLTALGQAEDKTRADSLGADRYLVKSQVTLEDIVKAAGELLAPEGNTPTTAAPTATSVTPAAPVAVPAVPEPVQAVTAVPKPQPAVPAPTQVAPPPVTTPSVGPLMPVTPPQQNETPVPSGPTPTIAVTPAPAVSPAPSPNPSAPPTIPSPATPTIPSRPTPPSAAPSVQTPTPVVTSAPTGRTD